MPTKINVVFDDKDKAKALGARWLAEEKTWAIPDHITDLNPFAEWLPKEECFIIKSPYIIVKSSRACWHCHKDIPLIALGATSFYALDYFTENDPQWSHQDYPILFTNIEAMDHEVIAVVQQKYPFFQLTYSKTIGAKYWANTCIHCHSLQGDNYNFMESNRIFSFTSKEETILVKREYLKLKFNYYISAGSFQSESNEWILC